MIFLLLKLHEKQIKKKQPTCIPWRGTSRTDTWEPHQAETSSSCLWNTKLGARETTNSKHKTRLHHYQTGTPSVSPDSSPLSQEYFKPTFNLPTPIWERRSKPSPLDGHFVLRFQAQAPPKTPPRALWRHLPFYKSHSWQSKRSSSEEMGNVKALSACRRDTQRGVGKAV